MSRCRSRCVSTAAVWLGWPCPTWWLVSASGCGWLAVDRLLGTTESGKKQRNRMTDRSEVLLAPPWGCNLHYRHTPLMKLFNQWINGRFNDFGNGFIALSVDGKKLIHGSNIWQINWWFNWWFSALFSTLFWFKLHENPSHTSHRLTLNKTN